MDTRSTRIKYSNLFKAVLSILVALLLFLSGSYMLLLANAVLGFGIPENTSYRSSNRFADLMEENMNKLSSYGAYGSYEVTRSSPAFQRALKEEETRLEGLRENTHTLFAPVLWLQNNQPDLIYTEEINAYLSSEDYDAFLTNKETAIYKDDLPYTTLPDPGEVPQGASYDAETVIPLSDPTTTGVYTSGKTGSYASRFPNARYNNYWNNYMQSAMSDFFSDVPDFFQTKSGSLSDALIDEYYNTKISGLQTDESLWVNFKTSAQSGKDFAARATNLQFAVRDPSTGDVYSNFASTTAGVNDLIQQVTENAGWYWYYTPETGTQFGDSENGYQSYNPPVSRISNGETVYEMFLFLPAALTEQDAFWSLQQEFETLQTSFSGNIYAAIILLALAAAIAIYLIVAAGRKSDGSLALMLTDRVYHDLHFVLSFGLAALILTGCVWLVSELGMGGYSYSSLDRDSIFYRLLQTGIALAFAAAGMLMLEWLVSASRNIKKQHFWRQTLCFKLLCIPRWILRKLRGIYRRITSLFSQSFSGRMVYLKKHTLLAALGYVGVNGILILFTLATASYGVNGASLFSSLLIIGAFNLAVLLFLWKSIKGLDRIMNAARSIRSGELNTALNMNEIPGWLQAFAKDVLDNQEGLRNAVADAVKNERMKAELITNVSHDLKTPLTSIVSYVSLLKKCEIADEDAQKYVAVLDEKAERMKRLIEDLVEASKASTGNISLNLVHVNLYELAVQAIGENSDDLDAKGIDCRIHDPEGLVIVQGDSQRTWRVIDNLFSNAKKYAMQGTRIYVEVKAENGYGVFTMKNISKNALNIPAEELTQRFVRGDEARGGEGSGLGLSIAKSLCELQKGTFDIEIDGDLFKAIVRLPLVQ